MANINIGGRLHSSATGNVVSGANEILDDTKGKKQDVINAEVDEALAGKQATIDDLSTIRSGATAGATAYQKPGTGIPSTDMASGVQTSLGKADSAYQKPSGGIPKTDLNSGAQASLDLADSAVQADPVGSVTPPVTPSDWATAEEVEGLEHKYNNLYSFPVKTGKGILVSNGTESSVASRSCTDYIDISNISRLVYARHITDSASNAYGIAFYNTTKTFISGRAGGINATADTWGYEVEEVEIPASAVYARFTMWTSPTAGRFFFMDAKRDATEKRFEKIEDFDKGADAVLGINSETVTPPAAAPSTYQTGYIITSNGNFQANPSCSLTNPITINKGETLMAICRQYDTAAVFFKSRRANDLYGNPFDVKVFGQYADGVTTYRYTATEETEYIGIGYMTDFGVSVFKAHSDTIDKIDDSIADVLRESETIITSGTTLFPFVQGARVNGVIGSQTNRITSGIVNFKGTIVIEKDAGNSLSFMPIYRAKGTDSWVEQGWQTTTRYTLTGDGEIYVNVNRNSEDITPDVASGFNCYIVGTPTEISQYPTYKFTAIGHGESDSYYDEPGIILRKNRIYNFSFDGVLASSMASGAILNIGAFNVDDPEQNVNIAYREAGGYTIPTDKTISFAYDAFVRVTSRLSVDAYFDVTIQELPTSIFRSVKQIAPDTDKINLLVNSLKCKQFLEGELVTEPKDILVFGAGIDIVEGGDFYLGLNWAENAAGEYGNPHYNVGLITGNVVDPYGTKERYTVALYGDEVVDGEHYDAISGETFAKRINDNEVAVFEVGYYLNGVSTAATKTFNLQTKTFGAFQKCYINVDDNGTNRRFQIKQGEADIRTIHQITGMHNWDDVPSIGGGFHYYAGNNPIKIGEYFYMFLCIGDYSPALVRTQDFIDFYFVCELPFGAYKEVNGDETFLYNPTEEVALEYLNNRLYASCRGNKGRFNNVTEGVDYYGYNQIMSADFDDVLAGTAQWDIVNLEPYWYEKPSLVAWNDQLFLLTGARGQWSYKGIEGKNLARYKHMFFVFDRSLNILKQELLNPDDGWLHPTFQKYGNSVYSVNHTDVRNFTFFGTGNNRSELRLKRLDMQILGM